MKDFAICIVGDLRTFGMQAIRENLLWFQKKMNADVFFDVKERRSDTMDTLQYNIKSFKGGKKCQYTTQDINKMLLAFRPKDVVISNLTLCKGTESSQYEMLHRCFTKAMMFSYKYFIRLRPDFYISSSNSFDLQSFKCEICSIMGTNADIFFVMNRNHMHSFLSHKDLLHPICGGGCCLDYHPNLFTYKKYIQVDGGLVRDSISIRGTTNKNRVVQNIKNLSQNFFICKGILFSGKVMIS